MYAPKPGCCGCAQAPSTKNHSSFIAGFAILGFVLFVASFKGDIWESDPSGFGTYSFFEFCSTGSPCIKYADCTGSTCDKLKQASDYATGAVAVGAIAFVIAGINAYFAASPDRSGKYVVPRMIVTTLAIIIALGLGIAADVKLIDGVSDGAGSWTRTSNGFVWIGGWVVGIISALTMLIYFCCPTRCGNHQVLATQQQPGY